MTSEADDNLPDYSDEIRADLAALLNDTPPGSWVQLGVCPGPYGCPFDTDAEAIAAGVQENFCDSCRVIMTFRPL